MLGWGLNYRGVETRHCRPHPQTRQTEEGAWQLQTHLPDIPPREVYERVIKNRLEYHCESKKVFPVCQAGFRRGRGVTDHLVKLGEHVGRAIGRRKVLLTCFFNISRAYDQVWHAKLLQKLNKIGISGNMYNLRQILPERQIDAGQVEGSNVDHQRSKYGRSSGICDRPPVVQHHSPRRGHGSERKGSADHVRRRPGDMDGHPHQTSPHKQLVGEAKHETVPGSCGRGGPLYASKWIRSLFPQNGVRPIPHQHLSEHGGAHQGERAEHLCLERSQVPGCTHTFPQLGLIPAAEEGVNVSVFPAPNCSLLDLIPATTTSVCLHTQVLLAAWLQASILLQMYLNYHVRLRRF